MTSTKHMTDREVFDAIEARLGTGRTWDAFIDELAKRFPNKSRLEVERAAKRDLAESRRKRAEGAQCSVADAALFAAIQFDDDNP
jgi:hypothetical protein